MQFSQQTVTETEQSMLQERSEQSYLPDKYLMQTVDNSQPGPISVPPNSLSMCDPSKRKVTIFQEPQSVDEDSSMYPWLGNPGFTSPQQADQSMDDEESDMKPQF